MTYHLLEIIGEGTFGRVRKVYNKSTLSLQAVKFCYVEVDDEELETVDITNMLREVGFMTFFKNIRAPHCMPIINLWILDDYMSPGLIMPLMDRDISSMIHDCKYGHWNKARKHLS